MQLSQGRDAAQLGWDAAGECVAAEQQSLQAGQLTELGCKNVDVWKVEPCNFSANASRGS